MKRTLSLAALIALGAAFAPLPALAQADIQLYIGSAPPAPIYEVVPAPRHGYVWAPGYWEWRGHRHAWIPGRYIAGRPGYAYAPPSWHQRQGRWYMAPAQWTPYGRDRDRDGVPDRLERRGYASGYGYYDGRGRDRDYYRDDRRYGHDRYDRGGRRDTDRDGIPNRYDRDRDNDGIRNDRDRDRDGDRVPNRYDSQPNNPYRR
ncbi:MAG: YXWGXW repeat-containing protein [Janthinobacterium lividum]